MLWMAAFVGGFLVVRSRCKVMGLVLRLRLKIPWITGMEALGTFFGPD